MEIALCNTCLIRGHTKDIEMDCDGRIGRRNATKVFSVENWSWDGKMRREIVWT